ncbi:UNVERIFIED_CONTAM: hypothetical protein Sradi_3982300 [Sesamum radiatum]|uniref:DUF4216 domain-containing protein n=1 Tax=Sesamum radiatum TaxID=300843 RepID=A0AAW2PGQ0_SESRA
MPRDHSFSVDYYNTKKLVKDLGLPIEKIDACKNGCMYWKDDIDMDYCKFCGESRYKPTRERNPNRKQTPYAVLRYLPITPHLQRLYASHVIAEQMTWHANHQTEEGSICHPSDAKAWRHFDRIHPDFAAEPRNVRLGLYTDGFAPHGQYDRTYSCWPVILTPYNLPLEMCMSSEYMFLTIVIPGPSNLKCLIDVYLEPLIEKLQNLWHVGVLMCDNARDETFSMRAALMWTVNDLPAYGMAFGWNSAGVMGCPVCMEDTRAFYLQNVEVPLSLPDGYGIEYKWTKKSIFWELEYWSTHLIRYNLDVMHIEKNVFDNIFNTVMDIKGKTKDNLNARKDLKIICNRPELEVDERRPNVMPKAVYTLTREQKRRICEWITYLKFSDGYASNLARCVDMKELSSSYKDTNNDFYGILEEVIQLDYPLIPNMQIVLFKCHWVDPVRGIKVHPCYHLVDVNFKKVYQKNEPFILAQQAVQVYYTEYPSMKRDKVDWMVVCKIKVKRDVDNSCWTEVAFQEDEAIPTPQVLTDDHNYALHDLNGIQLVVDLNQQGTSMSRAANGESGDELDEDSFDKDYETELDNYN